MQAILIKIDGTAFLLPDSHGGYEFPGYVLGHLARIRQHIDAVRRWAADPLGADLGSLPDLAEFKRVTGIIGWPLNSHDPQLYALDRGIEIVMELEL